MPTTVRLPHPIALAAKIDHDAVDTGIVVALIPIAMCLLSIALAALSPALVTSLQAGM